MNWVFKHLNFSWLFAWLIAQVFLYIAQPSFGQEGIIIAFVFLLPISGWVISQKGRSLWWLLLSGLFSPLWLTNKKIESFTNTDNSGEVSPSLQKAGNTTTMDRNRLRHDLLAIAVFLFYELAIVLVAIARNQGDAPLFAIYLLMPPFLFFVLNIMLKFIMISEAFLIGFLAVVGFAWVLKKKQRSLTWLVLIGLVPLGWLSLLFLNTKHTKSDDISRPDETQARTSERHFRLLMRQWVVHMKLWHGILLATAVLIMIIGGLFGLGILPVDNPRLTAEQVISHVQVYGVPDIDMSAYIGDAVSPVGQWAAVYEGDGKWRVQGAVVVVDKDDYHSTTWTYTDEKIELIAVRPPFEATITPGSSQPGERYQKVSLDEPIKRP